MSIQPYYIERAGQGPQYKLLDQGTDIIPNPNLQFKIVIVGDSGCGKTSLFSSYIRGSFPTEYEPTIFENHRAFVKDEQSGEVLTIDLWDTAGQEDYERLRRLSYQDSNLIILAYSLSSRESVLNIPEAWGPEILGFCENTPIVLVGLKADAPEHKVDPADALRVAKSIGAKAHIQCSAKEMFNVDVVFDACINVVHNAYKQTISNQRSSKRFSGVGHLRSGSRQTNNGYQDTSNKINQSPSPVHNSSPYVEHYEESKCCTIV